MALSQPGRPVEYFVGTAGWSYDDWNGIFYPEDHSSRFNLLEYYQRYFNMVEIDATFYRVMPPRLAEKWCRDVSRRKDFLFSMKLWSGLTHDRSFNLRESLEIRDIREMCSIFAANDRLGTLLLQFPWSFRFTPGNLDYLSSLLDAFDGYPCTVEMRHSSWLQEEYLEFLRERSVAFCNIDQPRLPQNIPVTSLATAPFSYLRLHGRNAANWFRENVESYERYNYLYSPHEVEELAQLARALAEQTSRVMITGNNHYRGQAAINALQLRVALEGQAERIPSSLAKAFPQLASLPVREKEEVTVQPDMFD